MTIFSELSVGDFFEYGSEYFVVIQDWKNCNVICLNSGQGRQFLREELVTKLTYSFKPAIVPFNNLKIGNKFILDKNRFVKVASTSAVNTSLNIVRIENLNKKVEIYE